MFRGIRSSVRQIYDCVSTTEKGYPRSPTHPSYDHVFQCSKQEYISFVCINWNQQPLLSDTISWASPPSTLCSCGTHFVLVSRCRFCAQEVSFFCTSCCPIGCCIHGCVRSSWPSWLHCLLPFEVVRHACTIFHPLWTILLSDFL